MPKFFAIIVLLCCAVGVCRADDAPQAWVNAVDTNVMERVLFEELKCISQAISSMEDPMEAPWKPFHYHTQAVRVER